MSDTSGSADLQTREQMLRALERGRTVPRMTPAQLRAVEWLPSDGSWRTKPGRLSSALDSLWLQHRALVDVEWGDFGPRGGRERRCRLTARGVAVKEALAAGPGGGGA